MHVSDIGVFERPSSSRMSLTNGMAASLFVLLSLFVKSLFRFPALS